MRIRLPHVLSGMGLVLLAGLAAVAVLEERSGGAVVPGLVLIDQATLNELQMAELARGLEGARVEWVAAGNEPLAPFDEARLRAHRKQGYHTALIVPDSSPPPEGAWDLRTRPEDYRPRVSRDLVDLAGDDLGLQVRSHFGTRPFVLTLVAEPIEVARLAKLVKVISLDLGGLPSYRRSSVVLLGERRGQRRLTLRVDVGHWGTRALDALEDLLEPRW